MSKINMDSTYKPKLDDIFISANLLLKLAQFREISICQAGLVGESFDWSAIILTSYG